jgi:hypothetical protein
MSATSPVRSASRVKTARDFRRSFALTWNICVNTGSVDGRVHFLSVAGRTARGTLACCDALQDHSTISHSAVSMSQTRIRSASVRTFSVVDRAMTQLSPLTLTESPDSPAVFVADRSRACVAREHRTHSPVFECREIDAPHSVFLQVRCVTCRTLQP